MQKASSTKYSPTPETLATIYFELIASFRRSIYERINELPHSNHKRVNSTNIDFIHDIVSNFHLYFYFLSFNDSDEKLLPQVGEKLFLGYRRNCHLLFFLFACCTFRLCPNPSSASNQQQLLKEMPESIQINLHGRWARYTCRWPKNKKCRLLGRKY